MNPASPHVGHYLIDGLGYANLGLVLAEARRRGYSGSNVALRKRIKAGASTWAELAKSPDQRQQAAGVKAAAAKKARRKAEQAEMDELTRELDARKRNLRT